MRFVLSHRRIELGDLRRRNVRRIADQQVELLTLREWRKQVTAAEFHSVGDFVTLQVSLGHVTRVGIQFDADDLGPFVIHRDRRTDAAGTDSQFQNPGGGQRLEQLQTLHHQQFRLRARNQRMPIDFKGQAVELLHPHEVGHRFGAGAAFDQLPHFLADWLGQDLVISGIELDSGAAARVSQQNLGIEPGGVAAVLLEVPDRPFQDASNGPLVGRWNSVSRHSQILGGR